MYVEKTINKKIIKKVLLKLVIPNGRKEDFSPSNENKLYVSCKTFKSLAYKTMFNFSI